jgi:hypothetical protein
MTAQVDETSPGAVSVKQKGCAYVPGDADPFLNHTQ